MRKFTLFLALIGMISLNSCTVEENNIIDDANDQDTISEVWEYSLNFGPGNSYSNLITFPHSIYTSDMVLVYHLYGVDNGTDIWRLLPQTYYFSGGGELDYNFDFTAYDAQIFMDANFDMNILDPSWTNNQVFRILVIPAYFGNKMANSPVDFNDYEAVIDYYNLNNKKITKITK